MSISLYPAHAQLLDDLASDLKLSRSLCIQILLDVEHRDDVLRKEVRQRLSRNRARIETGVKTKGQPPHGEGIPTAAAADHGSNQQQ
jgi:hypothetical protein